MEMRDYLSIRRAYNLVRQRVEPSKRVTFSEFAILCRLSLTEKRMRTSDIAEYQGCLRPTMTHRTKHLSELGLIDREKGDTDRRNVVCVLTDSGRTAVVDLCDETRRVNVEAHPTSRITVDRMCRSIDAMGSLNYMASDLVLLTLSSSEAGALTVGDLVDELGFLQPTISMSVMSLADEGMVSRGHLEGDGNASYVIISDAGRTEAAKLAEPIAGLTVGRKGRKV